MKNLPKSKMALIFYFFGLLSILLLFSIFFAEENGIIEIKSIRDFIIFIPPALLPFFIFSGIGILIQMVSNISSTVSGGKEIFDFPSTKISKIAYGLAFICFIVVLFTYYLQYKIRSTMEIGLGLSDRVKLIQLLLTPIIFLAIGNMAQKLALIAKAVSNSGSNEDA
jgi:hypothetical protein